MVACIFDFRGVWRWGGEDKVLGGFDGLAGSNFVFLPLLGSVTYSYRDITDSCIYN
jgi:hypothetical protein